MQFIIPLTLLEQLLKLANLLLESTPPEIRRAQAIVWWALWWPVLRLVLKKDVEKQIEDLVAGIVTSEDTIAAKAEVAAKKAPVTGTVTA